MLLLARSRSSRVPEDGAQSIIGVSPVSVSGWITPQADRQSRRESTFKSRLLHRSCSSPSAVGGRYDSAFLANYAYISLNDQLSRVPGISNVQVFGVQLSGSAMWPGWSSARRLMRPLLD